MKICKTCGARWEDDVAFCGSCGSPLEQETNGGIAILNAKQTALPPIKNKKTGWIIGGIGAAVVIAVVIGMLTNWFGLMSPLHGLLKAAERTVKAESLTAKVTYKYDDNKTGMDIRVIVDPKDKELVLFAETDYGEMLYVDSDVYYMSDDYAYIEESDVEDEFFDAYDMTVEAEGEVDWKDILKKLELDDYVEHDKMSELVTTIYKEYLCSSEFLEDAAGFEKKGGVYTFKPDVEKVLETAIEVCEESDAFSKQAQKEIEYVLEDAIELAERNDFELEVNVTVKGGKLSLIEVDAKGKYGEYNFKVEITDVDKTKISEEEMDEFKEDTEQMIEENTCAECGDVLFWYDEEDHGDCDKCDEHGYLYQYDGHNYCYDCYEEADEYGYCDNCGDYEYMYSWNGSEYCSDCYDIKKYNGTYGYCDLCSDYDYLYQSPYTSYRYCYECYDDYGYFD